MDQGDEGVASFWKGGNQLSNSHSPKGKPGRAASHQSSRLMTEKQKGLVGNGFSKLGPVAVLWRVNSQAWDSDPTWGSNVT